MVDFWERFEHLDGHWLVASSGVTVTELIDRLDAGECAVDLVAALNVEPLDVIAAVAADGMPHPLGPPLVRGTPRRQNLAERLGESELSALLPDMDRPARLALAAGLLQIHDHWDASHEAAQKAEDLGERSVSAYWHGIAHRREPDAGNASYWFRRVGRHPSFDELAGRSVLDFGQAAARFSPNGNWDPFAFIEFATKARGADVELARGLQWLEMHILIKDSVGG